MIRYNYQNQKNYNSVNCRLYKNMGYSELLLIKTLIAVFLDTKIKNLLTGHIFKK